MNASKERLKRELDFKQHCANNISISSLTPDNN